MPKIIDSFDELMTRDNFRESVFKRDKNKCVFCDAPAKDAHHIIERRLFPDGGYVIDNGASVCEEHHLACERTDISVEDVRLAAGIIRKVLPPQLYDDQIYDKWGNPILSNGRRLIGELFFDESVQKIIANHLPSFERYVKYPRTYHLPWSEGINNDDRIIPTLKGFIDREVIVTKKMDGENTTMYRDHIHARSLDGLNHPSRNWVKNFWSGLSHEIPEGWRICGENLFATHSIAYEDLPSYFLGFSIWNERNYCLPWDETLEWFDLLGITPVETLFHGTYDENEIKKIWNKLNWETDEGYIMRTFQGFDFSEFKYNVAKFVRKGHVQTQKHWLFGKHDIPSNKMRG